MKILNRIIVFILGIAVLPVMYFRTVIRIVVSLNPESSVYTILSKIIKDTADKGMEITLSIKDVVGFITDGKLTFDGSTFDFSKVPEGLLVNKNWVIASAILIAVAIIIAIVIAGCGLFTKAYKTIMGLSAGGAACVFAAIKCFSHFTAPFLSGEMDIGALLGNAITDKNASILASIGSALLDGSINVDSFCFDSAIFTVLIIFIGILLWSLAYFVTLPQEKKPKTMKR